MGEKEGEGGCGLMANGELCGWVVSSCSLWFGGGGRVPFLRSCAEEAVAG